MLHVPAELDNKYANRVGEVDWLFTVEGFNNEKPLIPTGQLNWPVAVFGALGVLLIAGGIIVLTKKKKNENRELSKISHGGLIIYVTRLRARNRNGCL